MRIIPVIPRHHLVNGGQLSSQHNLVDRSLSRAELPIDREGSGNIAGIPLKLRARIDDHHTPLLQGVAFVGEMKDTTVPPAAKDRGGGGGAAPARREFVEQL